MDEEEEEGKRETTRREEEEEADWLLLLVEGEEEEEEKSPKSKGGNEGRTSLVPETTETGGETTTPKLLPLLRASHMVSMWARRMLCACGGYVHNKYTQTHRHTRKERKKERRKKKKKKKQTTNYHICLCTIITHTIKFWMQKQQQRSNTKIANYSLTYSRTPPTASASQEKKTINLQHRRRTSHILSL